MGGRSIRDRQLSVLRDLTPHVLIVTSDSSHLEGAEVPVVADRLPGTGALGGLYTALVEATTEQVLVIGCDMPFLTAPFLTYLAEQGRTMDAAVPRDARGRHPLCASYLRRAAGRIHARIKEGRLRVGDMLEDLTVRELGPDELARFNRDGGLLINVNTPDDYAHAQALATPPSTGDSVP